MKKYMIGLCAVWVCGAAGCAGMNSGEYPRWSQERARAWHARQEWLVGCNFIPSTAINQLEMWQAETFDPATIDRELGWAAALGFNTVRVYLHDLAWEVDPRGFKTRIGQFVDMCTRYGVRPMFVIFDDCWNDHPQAGPQPVPVPGVHNSGWVRSPGSRCVSDPNCWPRLERYVKDVIGFFRRDERILMWDLYNEPGNSAMGNRSLPLLKATFRWVRDVRPQQPVTVGVWNQDLDELNALQLAASDVITFHNYSDADSLRAQIDRLREHERPIICTEYMARTNDSRFRTHLPVFREANVGCYSWGFVSGKTQTIYPWGSPEGAAEPEVWFHDILRQDGTPFDPGEVRFLREFIYTSRESGR